MSGCCTKRMQYRGDLVVGHVESSYIKSRMEMDYLIEYVPYEIHESSSLWQNGQFSRSLVCRMVATIICIFVIISLLKSTIGTNYTSSIFFY